MRIALVSLHTSPAATPGAGDAGGMNVVVRMSAQALSELGHQVVVVTRESTSIAAGSYALGEAELVVLAARQPALGKAELAGQLAEFAAGFKRLGDFAAVHAHYWLSGAAMQLAMPDTALCTTLHTVGAQKNARLAAGDSREPPARLRAEKQLVKSSYVIANSHSEMSAIQEFYGAPGLGSAVLHPGVDPQLFNPRAATRVPGRLSVLGRVQPLKGQDLAVRAFIALARAHPAVAAQCELVIAGEPSAAHPDYYAHLQRLAATSPVAQRVHFLAAQDRQATAALLASSTLVLVPSHSETFGLVALEAAAAGAPVLVAAHTGLLEAAPRAVAAAHLDSRDPAVWADTIARLLADPASLAIASTRGRAHALAHSWQQHAAKLSEIYRKVAGLSG